MSEGKKQRSRKPNTKVVPALITLVAVFISCIISIIQGASFSIFVQRLLIVFIIFIILGTLIKMLLDYSFKTMDDPTIIEQFENQELAEDSDDVDDILEESDE